jgi:hypothetical protein
MDLVGALVGENWLQTGVGRGHTASKDLRLAGGFMKEAPSTNKLSRALELRMR